MSKLETYTWASRVTQYHVHLVHTSRLNFSDWPVYQMESACHGMAMLLKWSAMEYRREGGGSWNTAGVGWNTDGDGVDGVE